MLKTSRTLLVFSAVVVAAAGPLAGQTRTAHPVVVSSPDGRMRAELDAADGLLRYRVLVDGKQVLAPSKIGIKADDVEIGEDVTLGTANDRTIDEHYPFSGAHAEARAHGNEAVVAARSHGQACSVDLYVANDGVGVRLRLPAKAGRTVQADRSSWNLEVDPTVWAAKLDTSYESAYHQTTLKQLGSDAIGLPLTARVGPVYVALTEALVKD